MRPYTPVAVIAFAALAVLGSSGSGRAGTPETTSSHCPFGSQEQVEISGVIANMRTGHEEPQEQINSYFDLMTSGVPCGKGRIMVFAPGITPCIDGERAILKGRYYAPDPKFIDIAMMDACEVACHPE